MPIDREGAICDITAHGHGATAKFSCKMTKIVEAKSIEESLLFAKFLRNEKKEWLPRIGITDDSIGERMEKELKVQGQVSLTL